jgi:RNA polymerase sigma factor (sigma-70 family)
VNLRPDSQLLLDFAERRSDAAFAELVRRHLNLVHAAALRITRDPDLAKDVSQAVFIALANQAGKLAGHAILAGWLHRTARNVAAQSIRTETRRRAREQKAALMPEPSAPDPGWQHIAPQLDAALSDLAAADRDAILLRYFENQSAQQIANLLAISPEAAQKRVSRAVERLKEKLARRGVPTTAGSLAAAIAAYALPAAPTGLAALVSTAAISGTGSTLLATSPLLAMTTSQKAILATAAMLLLGVGVHQLSSSASPAPSDSAAVTPLPGKSLPRSEVSSGTDKSPAPSDSSAEERRRSLADLKRRWLAVGNDNARTSDQDALARESIELLSCSPEAYDLSNFLIEHEIRYGEAVMQGRIKALFKSPRSREARQFLTSLVETSPPDKQDPRLEEWSHAAGQGCPADEMDEFHASLKNHGCAQSAMLGRSVALMQTDPGKAVQIVLGILGSDVHSLYKEDQLKQLFMADLPETTDFKALEALLPKGTQEDLHPAQWSPVDWGRHQLAIAWAKTDPRAAVRHVMAHPDRMPHRLLESIVGAGQFGDSAPTLRWVSELPPGPYYDAAAKGVAIYFRDYQPAEAREIVLKMTDPKLREEALNQLHRSGKSDGG